MIRLAQARAGVKQSERAAALKRSFLPTSSITTRTTQTPSHFAEFFDGFGPYFG